MKRLLILGMVALLPSLSVRISSQGETVPRQWPAPHYHLASEEPVPGETRPCIGMLVQANLNAWPEWGTFSPVFAQPLRVRAI